MARQIDQKLQETWRQRIERQQQGSLSVSQFCGREGISPASFYRWKHRLQWKSLPGAQHTARSAVGKAKGHTERPSAQRDGNPFVQVPLATSPASPWIEIVFAEGAVVRLPQQNLAALQTVLQSLGGSAASTIEVRRA
jgi:hypothetical protein